MSITIRGATGNSYGVKVGSDFRLATRSVSATEIQDAVKTGRSYNINTGEISISADSALLYFKNNEDEDFFVDSIAIGLTDGSASDIQKVTVIRNPTAGTIVSGASAVAINQNRNFGSSKTLANSLAYKGASGNTITDGSDIALLFQTDNGRLFADVDFLLPKGSSIGVEIDVNLSSGSMGVYVALIGHLVEQV